MNQQKISNARTEQIKNFKIHKSDSEVTSLPFISKNKNKSGRNWFDLPITGNYATDCHIVSISVENFSHGNASVGYILLCQNCYPI